MASLEGLKELGYKDYKIDELCKKCYIYVENDNVSIIEEDLYYEIMSLILMKYPLKFDEFVSETHNDSLKMYFIFLRLILMGKLEESLPLMRALLRDRDFLEDYEEILLYVSIINEYELKDLYIPKEGNELLKGLMLIFKKYLLSFNYKMAKSVLKSIFKLHDCLEYRVIDAILEKKQDTINYMLDYRRYPDLVVSDNLKKMEREALCNLEYGNYSKFVVIINQLSEIYQDMDICSFKVLVMLVNAIGTFDNDPLKVSSRSNFTFRGDLDSVLITLLSYQDYYRVHDLIEEEIEKSKGFDIYLAMLYILIHKIMFLNDKNMQCINKRMDKEKDTFGDVIQKKRINLTTIDGKILKDKEEDMKKKEEGNINYYNEYKEMYAVGQYREARIALLRFIKNLRYFGINYDVDYLFKELDYLILNDKGKEEVIAEQKLAQDLMDKGQYREAIDVIMRWCSMIDYFNPRAQALLAKCYYKIGDFKKAISLYQEAEKYYLYPSDYEDMIMILYHLGRYDEIEKYYNLREEADFSSLKITYIMSIVEMKKKRYKKARKLLKVAANRSMELYGVVPNYDLEYQIIDDLSKGNSEHEYSEDDYIEYEITSDDNELVDMILEYQKLYKKDYVKALFIKIQNLNEPLADKIAYFLTLIKVLKNRKQDIPLEWYNYVDYLIELDGLTDSERKRFTIMKKNYQNL